MLEALAKFEEVMAQIETLTDGSGEAFYNNLCKLLSTSLTKNQALILTGVLDEYSSTSTSG